METIRNPVEWSNDQLKSAAHIAGAVGHAIVGSAEEKDTHAPEVRKIAVADLREVLEKGLDDFRTFRTDVAFVAMIYPLAGIALAYFALHLSLLPLIFPIASGFALVGPVAAIGLYEMSRRHEKGEETGWAHAFGMIESPSFGAILTLGLALFAVFLVWVAAAHSISRVTMGPEAPASMSGFLHDVFTTPGGWAMIVFGCGVGFLFAVGVLAVSVVSFPMLLEHDCGLRTAVTTSLKVIRANPVPMAAWGLIVAGALVIGSVPLFLGLIVIMPVLGHATWHLYRKVVA